ncbi:hypothetical protein ACBJ59_61175 [Nonomuraea sp. MTCD27]|uniref:hypothetical protein n=1 Tax=Nonomuraea sp. MTCD27 TaxID=1676747 RepID=UPI0035C1598D
MADRPVPGELAHELADAMKPGRVVELGDVDHALELSADLQRVMSLVRRVALTWDDASALLRAAMRNGRLAAGVAARVSDALSEAFAAEPGLRPTSTNAVPPAPHTSDHGGNSTHVD